MKTLPGKRGQTQRFFRNIPIQQPCGCLKTIANRSISILPNIHKSLVFYSFGYGCAEEGEPGYYTDVFTYIKDGWLCLAGFPQICYDLDDYEKDYEKRIEQQFYEVDGEEEHRQLDE